MRHDVDWNAVRDAYRTGVPRLSVVAEIHNVPKTTIISRAKRWGWRRDLAEKVKKKPGACWRYRRERLRASSRAAGHHAASASNGNARRCRNAPRSYGRSPSRTRTPI